MIRIRPVHEQQFLNPQRPRCHFEFFALTRQLIGALPVNLDGGIFRRHLHHIPDKATKQRLDVLIRGTAVALGDHLALGVIGVGRLPQSHAKRIGLERVGDIGHRLGRLAKRYGQNPRRLRVERAGVARLLRLQRPFHLVDHGG